MKQALIKNWWLLVLCAVIETFLALITLFAQGPDGNLMLRVTARQSTVMQMCWLAVLAGACTVVAGIWSSRKGISWLLILSGLAFIAYGVIPIVWTGPLSFRPFFGLLLVVMAMGCGILALTGAPKPQNIAAKWFLGLAGATSVGYALAILALDLRWINFPPPSTFFTWTGSYFAVVASCMIALTLRPEELQGAKAAPAI